MWINQHLLDYRLVVLCLPITTLFTHVKRLAPRKMSRLLTERTWKQHRKKRVQLVLRQPRQSCAGPSDGAREPPQTPKQQPALEASPAESRQVGAKDRKTWRHFYHTLIKCTAQFSLNLVTEVRPGSTVISLGKRLH